MPVPHRFYSSMNLPVSMQVAYVEGDVNANAFTMAANPYLCVEAWHIILDQHRRSDAHTMLATNRHTGPNLERFNARAKAHHAPRIVATELWGFSPDDVARLLLDRPCGLYAEYLLSRDDTPQALRDACHVDNPSEPNEEVRAAILEPFSSYLGIAASRTIAPVDDVAADLPLNDLNMQERRPPVAAWISAQLGDDVNAWAALMTFDQGFDGTCGEAVELTRRLLT